MSQDQYDSDHLHEECGVFAIFGHGDAAAHTALGLHALQHRGQEACGIVSWDGRHFHMRRALGEVSDNFSDSQTIGALTGFAAIGHNRYATTGEGALRNVQPLFADFDTGGFAIAHNGNLTNATKLKTELVRRGSLFQSTSDTEVILHLISTSKSDKLLDRMVDALHQIHGAYSLVALTEDGVLGARDPLGIRPLVLGRLQDSYILASESCALDIIGAELVRDIKPGELVWLTSDGVTSFFPFASKAKRFCLFEYVYFARPDSDLEGHSVYTIRKNIGRELAQEAPVDADVIIPVPDSGVPAAIGYAQASNTPFELGIIRNHYVGRTFIEPTQNIRNLGVRLKHNANVSVIRGKRVVLVDDSIVRGTTSKKIVQMVRGAGAREVHMRISSPPTAHPCFYGIDTPSQEELIAHTHSVEQIARSIGVESLAFISIDGLYRAVGEARRNPDSPQFCDACFTGDYPVQLTDRNEDIRQPKLSLLAEQKG